MPKIVNIQEKRESIALSSTKLFLEKGFNKLTVSEVALNANIAKGSIYNYFDSKEDIVFAIIEHAQILYDKEVSAKIKDSITTEEKILSLFDLCISETLEGKQRRKLYKEFISICLDIPSKQMIKFQIEMKNKYTSWLRDILLEDIKEKKLKPEALNFTNGLFAMAEGVLIFSHFNNYHDKNLLKSHIHSLLKLIKTGE